jgi:type IV pilus assembly protein PilE
MKRSTGFTLIELMITVTIVAILTSLALPAYQRYTIRAVRASGQQYLTDLAQRQEQYFIDARSYATGIGSGAGLINLSAPDQVSLKYAAPVFTVTAGTNPTYRIKLSPLAGGLMASDGDLYINNLSQRWREIDGNGTYDSLAPTTNCVWENTKCPF